MHASSGRVGVQQSMELHCGINCAMRSNFVEPFILIATPGARFPRRSRTPLFRSSFSVIATCINACISFVGW